MMETLLGHDTAVSAFLDRFKSGRFPHAWLFEGPVGVGKAHAAHMLASVVLGADYHRRDGTLIVDKEDEIAHKIATGAHPDFRQVQRVPDNNGKLPQAISVDVIRDMNGFFELRAAQGGYRVAIVDSVDELNANSANALLKTLEEPPEKCLLLLIHHGSASLLPTIRSRCVKLNFGRLSDADLRACLDDADINEELLILCEGSPGRLREMTALDGGVELLRDLKAALVDWPGISAHRIPSVMVKISKSELHLELASSFLAKKFSDMAQNEPFSDSRSLYASYWSRLYYVRNKARRLNLDLAEQSSQLLGLVRDLSNEMRATA
jgi:DNA polymerase-3 subunit delta'